MNTIKDRNAGLARADIESESQRSARDAYMALIGRVLVFLLPKGPSPDARPGSAIILSTSKGVPFLLSARHMFEDRGDCSAMSIGNGHVALGDVCDRVFLGPSREGPSDYDHQHVDVAAVALRPEARAKLADIVGTTVATSSDPADNDWVVVSGFPSFLTRTQVGATQIDYHVASISYVTSVQGRDDFGRLRVDWDKAKNVWASPDIPHFKVPDGVFELGRPHGISGGGLWQVRSPRETADVWSPSSHCQLIGVPVAVQGKVEYAEPVELWRSWLNEIEQEIDSLAGSR